MIIKPLLYDYEHSAQGSRDNFCLFLQPTFAGLTAKALLLQMHEREGVENTDELSFPLLSLCSHERSKAQSFIVHTQKEASLVSW